MGENGQSCLHGRVSTRAEFCMIGGPKWAKGKEEGILGGNRGGSEFTVKEQKMW